MSSRPVPPARPAPAAPRGRPLWTSVGVGVGLGVVVIATLLAGPTAFFVLSFAVVLIAQAELYAVLKASGWSPATLLGLVIGGVLLIATYRWGPPALGLGVALPLPLLLAWGLTVPIDRVRSMVSSTYLAIVYGPFLIGYAILLLRGEDGLVLTATVVGATAVHDSAAYLLGRKIGRRALAPRTSPGKTWEGYAAGTVVLTALAASFLPLIHPFDVWLAVRLALVVSVAAPMGDLAESLLKRDLGVKDMGSLVPGHGGFFDRIDGILFSAPAAYLVLRVLGWAP